MQQPPKTTRKRLPKRAAHARALAAASTALGNVDNADADLDEDEMSHTVLQRGSACLSCRKRKLKCDAARPACRKCLTAGRPDECVYDDGKQKTRTQLLQEKVKELEEKLLSLESTNGASEDGSVEESPDQPPPLAPAIISLPNGTLSSTGPGSGEPTNTYAPQSLFGEAPQDAQTHYDTFLNRDTGTLQVFSQQDTSTANLLDVTSGRAPSWLGDFTNFDSAPTTKSVGSDFANLSLARAIGSPPDNDINHQLTAFLTGSAITSGTHVGFSSMSNPGGQPTVPSQFIDVTASYGVMPDPALSFNLDSFPDVDGVPARWLDQDQLPTNIRNYLIDLFLPHRHRCGFEVHIGRFLASLDLPIDKRPHPLLEGQHHNSAAVRFDRGTTFWHEFRATDTALSRIAQTLPHIHSGAGINDTSSLIFVHTFIHGSTIQLHAPFLDTHPSSYERCVQAAAAAMKVVYMIDNIDAKNFHMLMGLSWMCVADVLKREIRRKRSVSDEDGARKSEQELEALVAVMKRLRQVYPVLGE
ncbi:hypothetical protein FRC06_004639 [Ceratobasidium sp. 370]|nr:hypothetical protein FRC06_004639 [Ceratobasidium sp. 370]